MKILTIVVTMVTLETMTMTILRGAMIMKTLAQQEVIRMKTVMKMAMVMIILTMKPMMMTMKISTSIATKIITLM